MMKSKDLYRLKKGKWGEDKAAAFLVGEGYSIIERNYRCRWGEIDIIAERSGTIHFIEVKARSTDGFGSPLEAITNNKMQHIIRAAQYYIHENSLEAYPISFDGIGLTKESIDFVQGINV